jgi:putative signal transducing protein
MKQVLATHDRFLAESARIALESEGIETIVASDVASASHAPVTLEILRDDDYDHALMVLRTISATPPRPRNAHWARWPIRLAILLLILWFVLDRVFR